MDGAQETGVGGREGAPVERQRKVGEACGTEKVPDTHLQTPAEPGDANLLSASCPPSLQGQMLPWSQPDLWSEGKKKGGGGGVRVGGLRDPSLTLPQVSPQRATPLS